MRKHDVELMAGFTGGDISERSYGDGIHSNLACQHRVAPRTCSDTRFATIDGGGCSSYWTANSLDDVDFMKYVWPLLLTAKATGTAVTLSVNGCVNTWGRVVQIDLEPRLAN